MKKIMRNKLAVIVLAFCVLFCVGTVLGINSNTKYASAEDNYAVTENYYVYVSRTNPATLELSERAGQYVLTAVITEVDGMPMDSFNLENYELIVEVNGESLFLNYNLGTHTFTGVIMVGDEDILELTTFTSSELALSITIGDLYIGQDNDFTLSNVQLPADDLVKINLDNLMGKYKILVDLGMKGLEYGAELFVEVDGDEYVLTKNDNYFSAYSAELNFGDGVASLTIYSTNSVALMATISLSEVKEYKALPSSVDLEMWTTETYKYTATRTGYFSLNTSSTDSMAEVSIIFRTDVESLEGLNVTENNYPLYMEAGNEYYFELVLMNSSNETNATIDTTVENWDKPTIETDIAYPVPVTVAGKDIVTMNVVAEESDYNLSLMGIPFNWYLDGITVTANIGGEEIDLTHENNYATEIYLDGDTTISLTATANAYVPLDNTTLTLYIATPEVRNYMTLDKATEITVPTATYDEYGTLVPGNAIYYLDNAQAGFYEIMLSENDNVSVDANWLPAVFKGDTVGGFRVTDSGTEIVLDFYNYSTESEAYFTAIVSSLYGEYDLKLGVNEMEINRGTTVFYIDGLAAGDYVLNIFDLPYDTIVYIDGIEITLDNDYATYTVSIEQDNKSLITIMFISYTDKFIVVDITPVNVMSLNEIETITTPDSGNEYYVAYYMYLESGEYEIQLSTPYRMYVAVFTNEYLAISYGDDYGTFYVDESGYVALKFVCFTYGAENSFDVLVSDGQGPIILGELPPTIDLKIGRAVTYKYTANGTGYFSLNVSSALREYEVYIIFKTNPQNNEGIVITENNYPIFMQAGKTYYIEFVLTYSSNNSNAILKTKVERWVKPTIMTDNVYSVPVTALGDDRVTMNLGTAYNVYRLSLMGVPSYWYRENITVFAYIGGKVIYLTSANNYATDITLNGETSISLMSTAKDKAVVSLYIATNRNIKYIKVGELTEINIDAATKDRYGTLIPSSAVYYLDSTDIGYYEIILKYLNGALISIKTSTSDVPIVNVGENSGEFKKSRASILALEFINYSEFDVEFVATVNKLPDKSDLKFGGVNVIKIQEGSTKFYFENLVAGNYNLTVSALPAGATISIGGKEITLDKNGQAVITISEEQDINGIVTVIFTSSYSTTITLILTPINLMTIDNALTITTSGSEYYTADYIYLEAGTYEIKLNIPKNLYVIVFANDELVIQYGANTGKITVKQAGFVALKFTCFTYGTDNTFTALVTSRSTVNTTTSVTTEKIIEESIYSKTCYIKRPTFDYASEKYSFA